MATSSAWGVTRCCEVGERGLRVSTQHSKVRRNCDCKAQRWHLILAFGGEEQDEVSNPQSLRGKAVAATAVLPRVLGYPR
jgi:hypothetical protein